MQAVGLRPGSDSVDDGVDLLVREHATCTLREGGHRRAGNPVSGGAANYGIVSDREKNRIAERNRCSSFAIRAVASRTVACVENIELHNLAGRDHLGVRARPAGRIVTADTSA